MMPSRTYMINNLSSIPATCRELTGEVLSSPLPCQQLSPLKDTLHIVPTEGSFTISSLRAPYTVSEVEYAMEALNAAGLTPISVLCERKQEPRKFPSFPSISPPKVSNYSGFSTNPPAIQQCLSRRQGALVLLSSVFSPGLAKALTYEEALQKSAGGSTGEDIDGSGVVDGVISFATENPAVVAGGAAILAVPLILLQLLKKPKPWGVESAKSAYAKLGDDATTQLLDIRAPGESRQVGSPDIKGLGKKPVSISYKSEDKPGFLKRLSLKFKEPENTTLFVLDKFDGNSELVAELATLNGFKAAYAIKDGAEGPRGWVNSSLPWIAPSKASFDLSNLTDAISDAIGEGSSGLTVPLGLAAATGFGLLAFSEIETILQLLGSAAIVQLVGKKLLFAEDRKQTIQQVDEFLNTKIAPKELVDEIKQIGVALLPSAGTSKVLPAPTEASPKPTTADNTPQKAETIEPKTVAAAEPPAEINSVPKNEVKAESLPGFSKPLSPYPYYPDFKPPTSPTPSQP